MIAPEDIDRRQLAARGGWSLVWLGVLVAGLGSWAWWSTWIAAAAIGPLLILVAFVGSAVLWAVRDPEAPLLEHLTFSAAALAAFFAQGVTIAGRSHYTTDSAAFNQIAADRLLHGRNPYTSPMMPDAARLLHGVGSFWTYTLSGGHIDSLSYPAGSFLLQAPFQLLGLHHLASDWVDLLAGIASALLMYLMLPRGIRWLSPAFLLTATYVGLFAHGGTDALLFPFLLLAVWRWDRFSEGPAAGWTRWVGPLALGVACSVKQLPWFCVPFLVLGVALEAHQRGAPVWRRASSYLAAAGAAFVALNLPFIIWSPRAWAHGVMLPLTNPLVPDGQGLVTLGLHGLARGIHIGDLTVAGVLAMVALLVGFVLWYRHLKRIWLFLLPFALFVPGRSLSQYLVAFFPGAIVAAVSVGGSDLVVLPRLNRHLRRALVAVPAAGILLFAALAFTAPVLGIKVESVTTTDSEKIYASMTVTLSNNTSSTVRPNVVVLENDTHPTGFWHLAGGGALELAPHETRTVTLLPPPSTWTSLRDQWWSVAAYVPDPASVSTSPPMRWQLGAP